MMVGAGLQQDDMSRPRAPLELTENFHARCTTGERRAVVELVDHHAARLAAQGATGERNQTAWFRFDVVRRLAQEEGIEIIEPGGVVPVQDPAAHLAALEQSLTPEQARKAATLLDRLRAVVRGEAATKTRKP